MNKKTGLDYFPLDVDFFHDEKIQFVSARFGTKGEAIAVRLMCKIYRQGYYVNWDDDAALLFAKSVGDGSQHSCVKDVVHELLKRGFFDRDIFERFGVLTSRGFQKRYIEATVRRKNVEMNADYLLMDVSGYSHLIISSQNANGSSQNVDTLSQNANGSSQSKVKKSKENESNKTSRGTAGAAPQDDEGKKYDHEGIPYKCSKYLADKILAVNPKAKVPKTDAGLYKWCLHIDRLLRIDKKPENELRDVLAFAVRDPFWSANILSTQTFRDKYDQLYAKMKNLGGVKTHGNIGSNSNELGQSGDDAYKNITSANF